MNAMSRTKHTYRAHTIFLRRLLKTHFIFIFYFPTAQYHKTNVKCVIYTEKIIFFIYTYIIYKYIMNIYG